MPGPERRLAAILSADIAGYSRLMAEDEDATIQAVTARREEVELHIRQHRGRLVDFTGDNFLAEFGSAVDAVECAVEIQRVGVALNAALPPDRKMEFRIGVHLGEIREEDGRLFGTGVIVAARLEGLAEPGGVCISAKVHEEVSERTLFSFRNIGQQRVKNIPEPVHAYAVDLPEATPAAAPGRPVGRVAAGIVALVALAVVGWWALGDEPSEPVADRKPPTSLVVLPFDDLSPDGDQEYFAHGMSEELTDLLASLPNLRVVGRTSAGVVARRGLDVEEIGAELEVGAVVEGSVRRSGERLRISVQLISASDSFHLWSDSYDRSIGDVFAVQSEIAADVAAVLRMRLAAASSPSPTTSLAAYDAYLTGRHLLHRQRPEGTRQAARFFAAAIREDATFALAHSGLADALTIAWANGFTTDASALPRADEAVQRALAIDSDSAEVLASLARTQYLDWRWDDAEATLRRAIALDPGYDFAHRVLGFVLVTRGSIEEGWHELRRAIDLDPLSPYNLTTLANAYHSLRRCEEAIALAKKITDIEPHHPFSRILLASCYTRLGRDAKALDALRGLSLPNSFQERFGQSFASQGILGVWRAFLDIQIRMTSDECPRVLGAALYGLLGDRQMTLTCLERGVTRHLYVNSFVKHSPLFDFVRDDPRFQAILEGMGLAD